MSAHVYIDYGPTDDGHGNCLPSRVMVTRAIGEGRSEVIAECAITTADRLGMDVYQLWRHIDGIFNPTNTPKEARNVR